MATIIEAFLDEATREHIRIFRDCYKDPAGCFCEQRRWRTRLFARENEKILRIVFAAGSGCA
jgi:hypothetical protein